MGYHRRIILPGLVYHVTNRGNNRQVIFLEDEDYERYLGILYRFKKKYQYQLFSYCLMTNHVHLLIKTSVGGTISQIMQSITIAHTRHYHYKYQSSGHVWQGRFTSPIVSDDGYMLRSMQYIEQNPVRAEMVRDIGDYRWSSYRLNVRAAESKLIDRRENPVFAKLGATPKERRQEYQRLMRMDLQEKQIHEIRHSAKTGKHYISQIFKKQIEAMLPRKRKRGRPRKGHDGN